MQSTQSTTLLPQLNGPVPLPTEKTTSPAYCHALRPFAHTYTNIIIIRTGAQQGGRTPKCRPIQNAASLCPFCNSTQCCTCSQPVPALPSAAGPGVTTTKSLAITRERRLARWPTVGGTGAHTHMPQLM
eukprot:1159551-Pelagomonas_calceolata.AAC.6